METSRLFKFLIVVISMEYSRAIDWCSMASCREEYSHTMCRFPSSGPSNRCLLGGNQGGTITNIDRDLIVNRHNELRRRVGNGRESEGRPGPQPPAESMPDLVWDKELAMIAQRWADQCDYNHDKCRNVGRFQVGQNIALSWTHGQPNSLSLLKMVDSWYNEVKDYDPNDISRFTSLQSQNGKWIGHYTQFVWAKTTKIGCGARRFFVKKLHYYYLVCNYGPSGNFPGQSVYKRRQWTNFL